MNFEKGSIFRKDMDKGLMACFLDSPYTCKEVFALQIWLLLSLSVLWLPVQLL